MTSKEVALAFLKAFSEGDVDAIAATLAPEVSLRGPLFSFDGRSQYLAALHADGLEPGECDIIEAVEDGDAVAVFYRYRKPSKTTTVAQWFRVRDGKICRTLLVFDPGGAA